MTQPATTQLAEQTYQEVLPLAQQDESLGWPLLYFIEAAGQTLADIETLVRDSDDGPGWSAAVDLDRAPDRLLDWLAQFVGVGPNKGLTADLHRERIRAAEGMKRGTPESIKAAAQTHLTGTKQVTLRERDGGAYRLTLITYTAETPDADAVCAAATALKPAGLVMTCLVVDGWTILELEAAGYADIAAAEADFASINDLESNIP